MRTPILATATVLTVACLAASACSNTKSPVATSTATPTTSETTRTSAAPTTSRFALHEGTPEYVLGGPDAFAFFDSDDIELAGDKMGSKSKATVSTKNGDVTVGFIPEGGPKDGLGFTIGLQQVPDAENLAVTAAKVRLPADGLTPEKFEYQASVFDFSGNEKGRVAIDTVDESTLHGVGLFGDTVLLRYDNEQRNSAISADIEHVVAVDLKSNRKLWENTLQIKDASHCNKDKTAGVYQSWVFDRSPDGAILYGNTPGLTAVDPETGKTRWVKRWVKPVSDCSLGVPLPGGTYPYRLVRSGSDYSALNLRNGATLAPGGVSYAIDRSRNLFVVSYVIDTEYGHGAEISGNGPALQVVDLSNGRVLFELPGAKGRKFSSLDVLAAIDGKVWIRSSGDLSVIEAETGKTSPDSASLSALTSTGVPLYQGDKWMVLGVQNRYREWYPKTILWNPSGKFTLSDVEHD